MNQQSLRDVNPRSTKRRTAW